MADELARVDPAVMEGAIVEGNLERMSPAQRTEYYSAVCASVGLNPLTKPFAYIRLNGKLTLYALRDATDQLRKQYRVSVRIVDRAHIDGGVYVVTARAKLPDGREDESTGAVHIGGAKGESLANALMKAETKAKRRVTLSICGLGWLDESETDSIPHAQRVDPSPPVDVSSHRQAAQAQVEAGKVLAAEQAQHRSEDAQWATVAAQDVQELGSDEDFWTWLRVNALQIATLEPRSKARLWTAIRRHAESMGIPASEVGEAISEQAADERARMEGIPVDAPPSGEAADAHFDDHTGEPSSETADLFGGAP